MPFTMKLELLNGDSHFSEEESGWLQPLQIIILVVGTAAIINFYFAKQDHVVYERNDNPLFGTLVALTMLANKAIFQLLYMWQYAS